MVVAVVNPVTVGAAVKYVGAAWNILTSGGGLSRAESEAVAAAKQAGYSVGVRGYRDPRGRVVSQREVIAAGQRAQITLPDAPAPRPSDPGYRPDLTEKRIPPLNRPPPVKVPKVPKIPGRFGRIAEGIATVAGGTGLFEVIRGGIERVGERDPMPPPPPRPAAPPAEASPNELIGGRSPFYAPPTIKSPPPAPVPRPAAPAPAPRPAAPDLTGLEPINIYTPYVIPPAAPAPSVTSAAAPRSILGLSPAQLAGIAVPTLLALLAGGSRSRRRDPLTVPQTPTFPGLPTIPGLGLTPGSYPLPFPGGGFSGGGLSSSGTCECPPKRKRSPKKRRDVCYSGRYIERASGLSKTKLRKVPCR